METGTGDMIRRCRRAGLREPEFSIPGGFVATIYRKPGIAFETVSKASGEIAEMFPGDQVGAKFKCSVSVARIGQLANSWK